MLVFGTLDILQQMENKSKFRIYNMGCPVEMGINVMHLIPSLRTINEKDFDIQYANMLIGNNNLFITYMQIIFDIYLGNDVFVLVFNGSGDYTDLVLESLIKFIQQRYGIISNSISSIEDVNTLVESEFTVAGLYNLDIDKHRYTILTTDFSILAKELNRDE